MDGFQDLGLMFDFDPIQTFSLYGAENNVVDKVDKVDGNDIIHKNIERSNVGVLINVIRSVSSTVNPGGTQAFIEYLILFVHGKRNMKKEAVGMEHLNDRERTVYQRIVRDLTQYNRKDRILGFINHKDITKRLINYFVVHYILVQHKTSYYLDKRTYPFQIVGGFNDPNDSEALQMIAEGGNVVWIKSPSGV